MEEISLDEAAVEKTIEENESFFLTNLFQEEAEAEEIDDNKEYEIINAEDFKYYRSVIAINTNWS